MNDVVKTGSNLPSNVTALTGLAQSVAAVGGSSTGELFMKMDRTGVFIYGAEETEVEEGSLWAVNPHQFFHGWICWGDKEHGTEGAVQGEVMVPAIQPLPVQADLPEAPGTWTRQVSVSMRCMSGEDEGTECVFKTNSKGGLGAYAKLLSDIMDRLNQGHATVVPVVELESSYYTHKSYGKIFTPQFVVDNWVGLDGEEDAEEEPEEEPKAAAKADKKPTRSRRRKAS